MAITITRTPWIDDDGSGTTGTVLNNAVKTDLYAQIDAALAKAAQLAGGNTFTGNQIVTGNLTLNGVLTVNSPGTHAFTSGLAGDVTIQLVNTLAGATARATLLVGNNTTPYLCAIVANSSTIGTSITPWALPSGVEIHGFGSGGLSLSCDAAGPMRFFTQNVQRMQITAAGEMLINQLNDVGGGMISLGLDGTAHTGVCIQDLNPANTATMVFFLNSAAGGCGFIGHNGATTVAYNTSSDARLKTDAGRATDLSALRAVVVHDFTWKADGVRDRGVFAQEAHAHFPRAVSKGTDDRTDTGDLKHPWMADYSKFVADLIVGWQQHDATIEMLRAELATWKGLN